MSCLVLFCIRQMSICVLAYFSAEVRNRKIIIVIFGADVFFSTKLHDNCRHFYGTFRHFYAFFGANFSMAEIPMMLIFLFFLCLLLDLCIYVYFVFLACDSWII